MSNPMFSGGPPVIDPPKPSGADLLRQRDLLYAALVGLVGASDPEELRTIEIGIRLSPAPEADKVATINAIHALIECAK